LNKPNKKLISRAIKNPATDNDLWNKMNDKYQFAKEPGETKSRGRR